MNRPAGLSDLPGAIGVIAHDFLDLLQVRGAWAGVLWRPGGGELVAHDGLSRDVEAALGASGADVLSAAAAASRSPVRIPVRALPEGVTTPSSPSLRGALHASGYHAIGVLPLTIERESVGGIIVPLSAGRATGHRRSWRTLGLGLEKLVFTAIADAIETSARVERRLRVEAPDGLVSTDVHGRVVLVDGLMSTLPGWDRSFGRALRNLPQGQALTSVVGEGLEAPHWHNRSLDLRDGSTVTVRVARLTTGEGRGVASHVYKVRLIDGNPSGLDGRERLFTLALRAAQLADRMPPELAGRMDRVREIIDRGGASPAPARTDLHALAEGFASDLAPRLSRQGVRLFTFSDTEQAPAASDPELATRALDHMVGEALDGIGPEGGS